MSKSDLHGRKVICHDMCLRDGMHAKKEQISVEQMRSFAEAMERAGVPMIQVTHGAGLGGNSLQHGFALHSNEEYWDAVAPVLSNTVMSVLLIPGLAPWMNSASRTRTVLAACMWLPTVRRPTPLPNILPVVENWAWIPRAF